MSYAVQVAFSFRLKGWSVYASGVFSYSIFNLSESLALYGNFILPDSTVARKLLVPTLYNDMKGTHSSVSRSTAYRDT